MRVLIQLAETRDVYSRRCISCTVHYCDSQRKMPHHLLSQC